MKKRDHKQFSFLHYKKKRKLYVTKIQGIEFLPATNNIA